MRGRLGDVATGIVDGATDPPRTTRSTDQCREKIDSHVDVLDEVAPWNFQRTGIHPPQGQDTFWALG